MGEVNSEISCLLVGFSSFSIVQRTKRSEECKIGQGKWKESKGSGGSEHRCDTETPAWPRPAQEHRARTLYFFQGTLASHPLLFPLSGLAYNIM